MLYDLTQDKLLSGSAIEQNFDLLRAQLPLSMSLLHSNRNKQYAQMKNL
jgi:hypothetical protein